MCYSNGGSLSLFVLDIYENVQPFPVYRSGGATGAVCIEQLTKEKEGDGEHESPAQSSLGNPSEYTWRIDLTKTECHWKDWFVGLSNLFLRCTTEPKILILAGELVYVLHVIHLYIIV